MSPSRLRLSLASPATSRRILVASTRTTLTVRSVGVLVAWGVASSLLFSGFHYVGALGDPWKLTSFVFRLLLGLALTLIYATRGFAAAVWTHAVYDVWVLVFR